jgi:hypothetical protein
MCTIHDSIPVGQHPDPFRFHRRSYLLGRQLCKFVVADKTCNMASPEIFVQRHYLRRRRRFRPKNSPSQFRRRRLRNIRRRQVFRLHRIVKRRKNTVVDSIVQVASLVHDKIALARVRPRPHMCAVMAPDALAFFVAGTLQGSSVYSALAISCGTSLDLLLTFASVFFHIATVLTGRSFMWFRLPIVPFVQVTIALLICLKFIAIVKRREITAVYSIVPVASLAHDKIVLTHARPRPHMSAVFFQESYMYSVWATCCGTSSDLLLIFASVCFHVATALTGSCFMWLRPLLVPIVLVTTALLFFSNFIARLKVFFASYLFLN